VAGILDSKSRVIDFSLTPQGRRQLSNGQLIFEKATVSDRSSFYVYDGLGAADATNRIYFETYSSAVDQITLESDDSGQLIPFGGKNLQFSSLAENVVATSGDNFKSLKVLLTDDPESPELTNFDLQGTSFVFYPSLADPARDPEAGIDEIESLMFDKRLSKKRNFAFLPPENADGSRLGYYTDVRQQIVDDTLPSLMTTPKKSIKYQAFVTKFVNTSPKNSLNIQVFQQKAGESGIKKLDLIDIGASTFNSRKDSVSCAGRISNNSYDFPVFVNMLTLVLV